ncbi:hypothetical protein GCM10009551_016880 [Nocardiopsis tropica]
MLAQPATDEVAGGQPSQAATVTGELITVVMAACAPLAVGGALYAGVDPRDTEHTMGLVPKAVETVLALGALWSAYWIAVQFVVRPDRGSVPARQGLDDRTALHDDPLLRQPSGLPLTAAPRPAGQPCGRPPGRSGRRGGAVVGRGVLRRPR